MGFSPSLAEAPALATGPALKQEERKSPVSGERPGGRALLPSPMPCGGVAGTQALPEWSSSPTAPRRLSPGELGHQHRQGRRQGGGGHQEGPWGQPHPGSSMSERVRHSGSALSVQRKAAEVNLKGRTTGSVDTFLDF